MEDNPVHSLKVRKETWLPLSTWIALACYSAIVIPHFGYLPIWDSMENLEEYLFHPRDHLTLDNLILMHNGHPSLGYFWPFWIGHALFPSQILMIHIINLCLGFLAIVAFGQVASVAFEKISGKEGLGLLTVAFAVHPVFVAFAINMSPDYGVLAYFLTTLWLLYSGRLGWVTLTGTLLIFSKEIGVPTYMLLVIFYLGSGIRKCRWIDLLLLAVPLLMLGLYCAHQKFEGHPLFPWMGNFLVGESPWNIYFPNPFKADFKMACLGPFILEFQWIYTAVILAGLLAGILARPFIVSLSGIKNWVKGINHPLRAFLFLLAGCLYIDSRTVIFTNQRYFLTLYALVLFLFFASLVQLKVPERARVGTLLVAILLLVACNFRTLDPISKKITGTIAFGSHQMLSIGTVHPDFGGLNRDELIYNLEHTYFSTLLDMALEKIRPTNETALVMPGNSWWMVNKIDARTYHRTESTTPPFFKPLILSPESVCQNDLEKPQTIFVLVLPNLDNRKMKATLDPFYEIKTRYFFDDDGYEMEVWEMSSVFKFRSAHQN